MRRKHGIGLLAAVAVAAIATSVGGQFGAQAAEPVAAQGGSDAAAATLGATAVAKHHPQKPAKKPLAGCGS